MRAKIISTSAWLLLAEIAALGVESSFTVREWGTFTSVVGSDGRMLPGLEIEEERLPGFVYHLGGTSLGSKLSSHPVRGVTVKMETPVLYFYSDEPLHARVEVGFCGGSISQWYPDRATGEQLPRSGALIDFSAGYNGSAMWEVNILPPSVAVTTPREKESASWPRARVPAANRVRTARGETEGFIFYRGLGHFALPLEVSVRGENLVLSNRRRERIPFAFLYEKRAAFRRGAVGWCGALEFGEKVTISPTRCFGDGSAKSVIDEKLPRALEEAGLSGAEAQAMVATWRESYFERDGFRVFWIVPRQFTDAVLPIAITPAPAKLERVLLGRTEVLTPQFEAELVRDFKADGGLRWANDRHFRAYAARVHQLVSGKTSVEK